MSAREHGRMGIGTRAIVASCALLWAVGAACGGDGGGTTTIVLLPGAFPEGFLPARLSTTDDTGDVAFEQAGDLYAVDGSADVTRISRVDGSRTAFSANVGGGAALRAIVHAGNKRFFVADDAGMVYSIDSAGVATPHANASVAITGLAIAPSGFGSVGGSLLAATTDGRILSITTGDMPVVSDFVGPGDVYVDLAISGPIVYGLDATNGEIDTIDGSGVATSFQGTFANPVGFTVNGVQSELLVADAGTGAGDGVLYAVPVAGGTPVALARYDFDPTPPSGVDFDGIGAVAWVARGSVVVHGTSVPRTDPNSANFGQTFLSPDQGYGDLELLQDGRYVLVTNRTGSSPSNFVFALPRDPAFVETLATGVGQPGEQLLSLAYDPSPNILYLGSNLGNLYQRIPSGLLTIVTSVSPNPLLGLEVAPDTFGAFGGHLVATTSMGEVFTIDPANPTPVLLTAIDSLDPPRPAWLVDLVFASDGRLFVLDNGDDPVDAQVIEVAPNGATEALVVDPLALGFPQGVAMDEGANRLLIATIKDSGPAQLIALSLGADGAGDESITAIANLLLQPGFFPQGIVYDRIGTAVVRQGAGATAIDAFSVAP